MFKVSKKGSLAAICAMMIVVGMGATAYAAPIYLDEAPVPVTYDNRNVIDVDENGQWGVVIPTAISFSQDVKEVEVEVEVVGINGYTLADFESLEVTAKVTSANGYVLNNSSAATGAEYELTLDDKTFEGDGAAAFEKVLGVGDGLEAKATGEAMIKSEPSEKGQYADILTFEFSGVSEL